MIPDRMRSRTGPASPVPQGVAGTKRSNFLGPTSISDSVRTRSSWSHRDAPLETDGAVVVIYPDGNGSSFGVVRSKHPKRAKLFSVTLLTVSGPAEWHNHFPRDWLAPDRGVLEALSISIRPVMRDDTILTIGEMRLEGIVSKHKDSAYRSGPTSD
jgi:hypothetical protein